MSERLTTSERPLPRPDADLGYLFRLAHQRFRALLDSELEDLGLSAQEYGILSVFETRPELSTSELARISQVTRQTMHTSVLSLEAAGLVERSARNQRVVLVRPTDARPQVPGDGNAPSARWSTPRSQILAARTSEPYERGSPAWRP
jgi:Transcriptional regulators